MTIILERPGATQTAIIRSDEDALDVARRLAREFEADAPNRDRERRLPRAEVEAFSQSGLWGISVPREFGGADVSVQTIADVFDRSSAADPLWQIPQNHFATLERLRYDGTPAQQEFFFFARARR